MGINAKSIPFVAYPATNLERSKDFYTRILGLECILDHPLDEDGHRWIEFEVGSSAIAISNIMDGAGKGSVGAALEVEDLDHALETLRQEKVNIVSEVMASPSCRFFLITDPDGNDLTIHQANAAS